MAMNVSYTKIIIFYSFKKYMDENGPYINEGRLK